LKTNKNKNADILEHFISRILAQNISFPQKIIFYPHYFVN